MPLPPNAFGGLVLPLMVMPPRARSRTSTSTTSTGRFTDFEWECSINSSAAGGLPAANASRYHDMGDFTRGRCCRFVGNFVIKNVYIDDRAATTQTPTRGGRAPTAVELASRVLRSLASGLFPPLRIRGLRCELKVQWRHVPPPLEVLTQRHPLHRHVLGTDCACAEQSNIGCTL
jgi:hypothetical protein